MIKLMVWPRATTAIIFIWCYGLRHFSSLEYLCSSDFFSGQNVLKCRAKMELVVRLLIYAQQKCTRQPTLRRFHIIMLIFRSLRKYNCRTCVNRYWQFCPPIEIPKYGPPWLSKSLKTKLWVFSYQKECNSDDLHFEQIGVCGDGAVYRSVVVTCKGKLAM